MAQLFATYSSTFRLDIDPSDIVIRREISSSPSSTIYEIQLAEKTYTMKLFHDYGDPGYSKKGRDLNRFRCELNAYRNLRRSGVCDRGFVPAFHGYIDRIDPAAFQPPLERFVGDDFQPRAIFLEYLADAEKLNCVNYSEDLFRDAIRGIHEIHQAFVHHCDIYSKNRLVVSSGRLVWIDLDVATTFPSMGTILRI
ncbi:hypothetical protein N7452_011420 [Penicillium brevicompactum]|uniref:Protein kinase domain-containing protein n=1 Tax=Penicillium brevicompactum TaxID=5074 RepID=A0A9W9U6U8_PENBR|nr:hypothetical protein N7452_011420 [Penicillium brevicompactum]